MRSFLISFFCFLWAFALVAPAIITLMDDSGIAMVQPIQEEHEEDGELEFETKLMNQGLASQQFKDLLAFDQVSFLSPSQTNSNLHPEILLPPPKSC